MRIQKNSGRSCRNSSDFSMLSSSCICSATDDLSVNLGFLPSGVFSVRVWLGVWWFAVDAMLLVSTDSTSPFSMPQSFILLILLQKCLLASAQ